MRIQIKNILLIVIATGITITGCKKWDDHNAITDAAVGKDLLQQIKENSNLSKFADLLAKSGYDKVIASSKTFTVFAPSNAALATIDATIVNDSARLSQFVGNYIANQTIFTNATTTPQRVLMLNGKYNRLNLKTIEDASITDANLMAKNGVVQVIDKMLPVLDNTWETLKNNTNIPAAQKAYMLSLFRKVYDTSKAIQIGINPTSGDPIYQAGTDSITTNLFWKDVHDLKNEGKEFSLIVLTDAAWNTEVNKFKPYFATGTIDSTTNLSSWGVVKDLAVDKVYAAGATPDTIISKFDVKVPMDKSSIVQTIKTSNGTIYIMNKVDVQPKHKLKQFYIEAENYRFTSNDRRGNTYFRDRFNPITTKDFRDVLVNGHGVALFNINYQIKNVYSLKYKAYWVAVNDFQTASFTQKLGIGSTASTTFGYTTVASNVFTEVLIGEFTITNYQSVMDIFLIAANSTTAAVNPLVCDYIRLEPVL